MTSNSTGASSSQHYKLFSQSNIWSTHHIRVQYTKRFIVCACADFLRTDSVRGVLPLDEREPGSCALTRAAAWTTVLPGPARDHHGPEDPVEEAGHRDDQDQDDPGELRHRHLLSPRGGNEVCIKCIESFCCQSFQYCNNFCI